MFLRRSQRARSSALFGVLLLAGCHGGSSAAAPPPTALAGADRAALTGNRVALDGGGSSAAVGGALSYTWTMLSQPAGSTATLAAADTMRPSFVPDRRGDYELRLVVAAGGASSAADTVTIRAVALPGQRFATGAFQPRAVLAVPGGPYAVAFADLDGDGVRDLAVPCSSTASVAVLLGRGEGSFRTPLQLLAGPTPLAVLLVDLDDDGLADIVVANSGSDDLSVYLAR